MPSLLVARLVSVPVVIAIVIAGVWLTGGLISDDFRTSMALTAIWFALAGGVCVLVAVRSRALRVPVLGAFVLTVAVVGAFLGLSTVRDRVVDERVVSAPVEAGAPADARRVARNVELASGRFRAHEHATRGTARVVRVADGRRFLTLTGFATSPGPDLRVRLVAAGSSDGGADGAIDLGALKGNRGDQQYRLPRGVPITARSVVIWCRAFSAPFGSANLRTV